MENGPDVAKKFYQELTEIQVSMRVEHSNCGPTDID